VCGAVAERLGGVGTLCCLGTGGKPAPLSVINQMNLGPQHKGTASAAQLADLLAAAQVSTGRRKGQWVAGGSRWVAGGNWAVAGRGQ
jgi:hypothetical protein